MSRYIAAKDYVANDQEVTITTLEPTDEAMDGYKNRHASTAAVLQKVSLTSQHIKTLLSGKALAVDDGEFVMFLVLPNPESFNLIRIAE